VTTFAPVNSAFAFPVAPGAGGECRVVLPAPLVRRPARSARRVQDLGHVRAAGWPLIFNAPLPDAAASGCARLALLAPHPPRRDLAWAETFLARPFSAASVTAVATPITSTRAGLGRVVPPRAPINAFARRVAHFLPDLVVCFETFGELVLDAKGFRLLARLVTGVARRGLHPGVAHFETQDFGLLCCGGRFRLQLDGLAVIGSRSIIAPPVIELDIVLGIRLPPQIQKTIRFVVSTGLIITTVAEPPW